jgi:hypothetical protein
MGFENKMIIFPAEIKRVVFGGSSNEGVIKLFIETHSNSGF